jgi:hypothetical protein
MGDDFYINGTAHKELVYSCLLCTEAGFVHCNRNVSKEERQFSNPLSYSHQYLQRICTSLKMEIGKARVLRLGKEITLVSMGQMVKVCSEAIKISGTNKLIINKCDILQDINKYKIITDDDLGPSHLDFFDFTSMKEYIINELKDNCEIIFSGNRNGI